MTCAEAAVPDAAAQSRPRPLRVPLPGGPTLVLQPDRSLPLVAVRGFARGGSVAEWPRSGRGVAHLTEHAVATAAATALEAAGVAVRVNAATLRDAMGFRWQVLAGDAPAAWRAFFDALGAAGESDVEAHKQVALEEIRLFMGNRLASFRQRVLETLYLVHPVRHPVCGRTAGLSGVTSADVRAYARRVFTPAGLCFAVVGDLDLDATVAAVSEGVARSVERGDGPFRLPAGLEGSTPGPRRVVVEDAHSPAEFTQVAFRCGGVGSATAPALQALAAAIGRDRRGGLRAELVGAGLARELRATCVTTLYDAGYFDVVVEHAPGASAAVEAALVGWLERLARGAVELEAAADDAPPAGRDTFDTCARVLAEGELRGRALSAPARVPGTDEIAAAVALHCRPEHMAVGHLAARARSAASVRVGTNGGDDAERLPNGVQLVLLPGPNPRAACQVVGAGGVLLDPPGREGLVDLTARLLPLSLDERRAAALQRYRAETRAELSSYWNPNLFGVTLEAPAPALLEGLEHVAGVVLRPVFSPQALERVRAQPSGAGGGPRASWQRHGLTSLVRALYPAHPYGRAGTDDERPAAALGLEDVSDCHRRLVVGDNLVVVVTGGFEREQVRARLRALLADVPAGRVEPARPRAAAARPPRRRPFIEDTREAASTVAVGFSGVVYRSEEFCALELLRTLLVGPDSDSVSGRLVRALRDGGLAYGVAGLSEAGFDEGYVALVAACAPGNESRVAATCRAQVERLRAGALDDAELARARRLYLLHHLLTYESAHMQAYRAARLVLLAGRPDAWHRLPDQLEQTAVHDVIEFARRRLPATAALTVVRRAPAPLQPEVSCDAAPCRGRGQA